jgi:hypothetical protein
MQVKPRWGGDARLRQSTVHVIGLPGSRRLALLFVQLGCLVGLMVLAVVVRVRGAGARRVGAVDSGGVPV